MKIQIHQAVPTSAALQDYIEKRIYFALGRFENKIRSIKVSLKDLNGPKGGFDKKCQFRVTLPSKMIVLESIEKDYYTASDINAERASRGVVREMDKQLSKRYRSAKLRDSQL